MKNRKKILFWSLPPGIIILEILFFIFLVDLFIPWKFVGKPVDGIAQILGLNEEILYVSSSTGEIYSLGFPNFDVPSQVQWVKEKEYRPDQNSACGFACVSNSNAWVLSPPLLFGIRQTYQVNVTGEGGGIMIKFVVSSKGELWYWGRSYNVYEYIIFFTVLVIEIVVYILALSIGVIVYLVKHLKASRPSI